MAVGPNSVLSVDGSISTNGGGVIFYVDGQGGLMDIATPLMLTGPTTLVAQMGITAGSIDPPSLDVYGPISATVNVPFSQFSYAAFPGIPFGLGTGQIQQAPQPQIATAVLASNPQTQINNPVTLLPVSQTPTVTFVPPPSTPIMTLDTTTPVTTSQTITSVTDLDSGGGLFTEIAPTSGNETQNQEPVTVVPPVTVAPQAQPRSQVTETELGSHVFQAHQIFVQHLGVPGISQPTSTGGNRSLWFASAPAP